jgi:mannosyltransferase OCH1-like enzyme
VETNIPHIIHQTWKAEDVPLEYREFQRSWLHHHPNWDYKFWTDEDNLTFVRDHYPWFLSTYESFPYNIQRVDVARILYLHVYGGIYADLDVECLRPVDALPRNHSLVFGREGKAWEYV